MKSCKEFMHRILVLTMLVTLLAGCGPKNDTNDAVTDDPSTDITANNDQPDANADTSIESDPLDTTGFSYSDGIDENGFWEGIKAIDYVEMFGYKELQIPSDIHKISDDSLQAEINNILTEYSSKEQITDRAVVGGDTVNIDYVGSVDGVEFDGGSTSGAGTEVTIGVTSYIDDFLEQLIGHTPGETFNVEVTFPNDYHEASLQGKDAVFVTTINHIVKSVEAELSDDFVKTNFSASNGWETVAKMKEGITEDLRKKAISQYIYDYFTNEVKVTSIPDKITKYQENAMVQYYQEGATYYGMEFDEFLSTNIGVASVDELIENNRESNSKSAKYILVAQAVAESENVTVSEADMLNFFTDYSQYEEQYGLPYLKQTVLIQNVIDFITENAVLA